MKTAKRYVLFFSLIASILSLTLIASAEEIQPYSVPTISSTTCKTCYSKMEFQDITYIDQTVIVQPQDCPMTAFWADGLYPHEHYYKLRYDNYECPNCGHWGRMLMGREFTGCQLTMSSGKNR